MQLCIALSGVQKFTYLHGQNAVRVIATMLTLLHYYSQPHKLINAHMEVLLNLENPCKLLTNLQTFYNTLDKLDKFPQKIWFLVDTFNVRQTSILKHNIAHDHHNS